jgi:PBP1b-binding outer membrane lipoprotein LpoB
LIDASAREKILKEIQYQNDGMVDAAQAKSIGKASGADLLLFGDIRMKPESSGGKTIKDYTVNLRLTNIETGEEVLRVRFRTSKYSVQKKSGW